MIEVILWDLDGTIHDSESLGKEGTSYGFRQVLGREPTEDEFAQLVGRPIPLVYKEWFDEDLANRILDVGTRYYQERADQIPCYTDVPELLIELKRCGYRMGVVSSKRKFHVVNELKSKALDSLFDVIIAQEDTSLHKPYPDPLLVAASHLKCQPENCIYIGDQPSDIQAAHAAGMKSIGALWGDGKLHRLEPISPTMLAHTPKDILDFIAENSLKKHSWTLVDDLEKFDLGDSEAYAGEWRNMKALHINKAGVAAFLKEAVPFQSFRLQAYVAIPEEVGFIGLVFGARDSSNYELIYLSPGNTEGIGEIQYDPVMNGSTTWQIYNGPNYLTHTPYTVGEWVQFTVDVHQHSATVYVGHSLVPQLIIRNLQHGCVEGGVGFWGYLPGYIRDLSIVELPTPNPANYESSQSNEAGFVTDWLVSDPYLTGHNINENNWTKAVVEENGVLNINRLYVSTKDICVQVKSSVTVLEDTQAIVSFGFSDELRLWINEEEVYQGIWMWNPPDHDGRIRSDHISIPIMWRVGKNTIRAEITSREVIFGWGLCLKWT